MKTLSQCSNEQYKRGDEIINEHLDMLIELLQGYKVLEIFSYWYTFPL